MSVLISVAHSSISQGAVSPDGVLTEYHVSLRASEACWRSLSGEFAAELYDCGPLPVTDYDDAKVQRVNSCMPELAVEIHCNAGPPGAKYHEVIYTSGIGMDAATFVCDALTSGFTNSHHQMWPRRGARLDDRGLFFLQKTKVPAIIVEGLFISNKEQAAWLATGGAEAYGILVATGIKRWLKGHKS